MVMVAVTGILSTMHQSTHANSASYSRPRVPCRACIQLLSGDDPDQPPHPYLFQAARGKVSPDTRTYKCNICSFYLKQRRMETSSVWS
jgi:hypothetical protein